MLRASTDSDPISTAEVFAQTSDTPVRAHYNPPISSRLGHSLTTAISLAYVLFLEKNSNHKNKPLSGKPQHLPQKITHKYKSAVPAGVPARVVASRLHFLPRSFSNRATIAKPREATAGNTLNEHRTHEQHRPRLNGRLCGKTASWIRPPRTHNFVVAMSSKNHFDHLTNLDFT